MTESTRVGTGRKPRICHQHSGTNATVPKQKARRVQPAILCLTLFAGVVLYICFGWIPDLGFDQIQKKPVILEVKEDRKNLKGDKAEKSSGSSMTVEQDFQQTKQRSESEQCRVVIDNLHYDQHLEVLESIMAKVPLDTLPGFCKILVSPLTLTSRLIQGQENGLYTPMSLCATKPMQKEPVA